MDEKNMYFLKYQQLHPRLVGRSRQHNYASLKTQDMLYRPAHNRCICLERYPRWASTIKNSVTEKKL